MQNYTKFSTHLTHKNGSLYVLCDEMWYNVKDVSLEL